MTTTMIRSSMKVAEDVNAQLKDETLTNPPTIGNVKLTISAANLKMPTRLLEYKKIPSSFAILKRANNKLSHATNSNTFLGKTEIIHKTSSPQWITPLAVNFEFGSMCHLSIEIWNNDEGGDQASNDTATATKMGVVEFELGDVLSRPGNIIVKQIMNEEGKHPTTGTIYINATPYNREADTSNSSNLKLQLRSDCSLNRAGKKKRMIYLQVCEPVHRQSSRVIWKPIYRSSPPIVESPSITWDEMLLSLLPSDKSVETSGLIEISIRERKNNGTNRCLGTCETTIANLDALGQNGANTNGLELRSKKDPLEIYGAIHIVTAMLTEGRRLSHQQSTLRSLRPFATVENDAATLPSSVTPQQQRGTPKILSRTHLRKQASFLDYITGGCELKTCIAIDFTSSNGDPRIPGTLHHFDSNEYNDYECAILSIGKILSKYSLDQLFPVWGFGANYGGVVRHLFQVGSEPKVKEIDGVLNSYRTVMRGGIRMSGPTVFINVINKAAAIARKGMNGDSDGSNQVYTILLILTDGCVSDIDATQQCIREAAGAPLSIVAVGIGSNDFSAMQHLQDFQSGLAEERPIFHFVNFENNKNDENSLSKATLQKIPHQLVSYFQGQGIPPLPNPNLRQSEIYETGITESIEQD